ncbi:MAG: hypothetical protein V2I33_25530, partial [Kangiellaceae bacterium]|nr:hypothetical protein [Kangiellaceae bacterium]
MQLANPELICNDLLDVPVECQWESGESETGWAELDLFFAGRLCEVESGCVAVDTSKEPRFAG